MTNTEQLTVPLSGGAHLRREAMVDELEDAPAIRSSGTPVVLALLVAATAGLWMHWRTLDTVNAAGVAAAVLLIALMAKLTNQRDQRRWANQLRERHDKWQALEVRLRLQVSESIRREKEAWLDTLFLMVHPRLRTQGRMQLAAAFLVMVSLFISRYDYIMGGLLVRCSRARGRRTSCATGHRLPSGCCCFWPSSWPTW